MTLLKDTLPPKLLKILLIGDVCKDIYYFGDVDRLSPEAPVPVIKTKSSTVNIGMAGNVQNNLIAFGCDITLCTGDEKDWCVKTRYIDQRSKQHVLRVDNDKIVKPFRIDPLEDYSIYDAVVISDYNKGFLTPYNIEDICKCFNGPIFIDTKITDIEFLDKYPNAYVKINDAEWRRLVPKIENMIDNLIVTQGAKGSFYNFITYPAPQVEVVDVCGAGDTYLAALTYSYLNTKDIIKAIKYANKAASISVTHSGVYTLTQEDIESISLYS